MAYNIINDSCLNVFKRNEELPRIDLTFLDPPFNQQKDYSYHNDNMKEEDYWDMMKQVCFYTYNITNQGGAIYFMQREKNTEFVLKALRETGWVFQNLIIWKKKTSAVPVPNKYGKQHQIIAYATKSQKPKTFHRLRINPQLPANYKNPRENGIFVTDVWDDIRELTSGFFAGNEAIRDTAGERFHKQQTPIALLLRIILTSTNTGDTVFDPFAGTGTTLVASHQLQRHSVGIEIDPENAKCINDRLACIKESDLIQKYYKDYICTNNLSKIWGDEMEINLSKPDQTLLLFDN